MENVSKALIMAGGMLMAILIITLAVVTYNGMRNSSRSQQESLSATQVSEFNGQFEEYNRNDVGGYDLISLINKIIDYNAQNSDVETSDRGYVEMTVTVTLNKDVIETGGSNNLFKRATYEAKIGKRRSESEEVRIIEQQLL